MGFDILLPCLQVVNGAWSLKGDGLPPPGLTEDQGQLMKRTGSYFANEIRQPLMASS